MYTVIGSPRSRAIRVLWFLEEAGIDYEVQPLTPRTDEVKAINPSGKVPVLLEGGNVFTDSTAIMTYLADKHAKLTFAAGTHKRATQDGHTNFLLDEFDSVLWMAARHSFILPEERRVPQIKDSLKWEFERSQARFAERLGAGPFLMGETMTLADILAAHLGRWATNAKFPITQAAFRSYIDRLIARPAFKRAAGD